MSNDSSTDKQPSQRIYEAVADQEDASPAVLDPPLAEAIDPDALDAFVDSVAAASQPDTAVVAFTYQGYSVAVYPDGTTQVTPAASSPPADYR